MTNCIDTAYAVYDRYIRFQASCREIQISGGFEQVTSTKSRISTSIQLRVPFYHIDMLQIVWNGHYLKYFEEARQAFFRERGVDLRQVVQDMDYVFPVIRTTVKHIYPLRLDDAFVCTATLREARVKIVLDFEIRLIENGVLCARGRSEQAALKVKEMEMLFKIPEDIRSALERNPKTEFFQGERS